MINSINFYSSNSLYGQGSNYSYAPAASGGSYLDALFTIGMQMLMIAIAKQQLQALVTSSSGSTVEKEDVEDDAQLSPDKNGPQNVKDESSCHCYCVGQEPEKQDEEEHDPEPNEVQVLQDMIQQLQQQTAYQAALQQSDQFSNYLATSFSDRQIIRSIQLDGGRVLRQYSDHFLAEDYYGNRYSVSRNPFSPFNK